MSHTVMFTEGAVEERLGALEKYLTELQLHRDSRRGLEGARGEKGEPGISNVPGPCGPAGRDGKDADITLALKKVREELDAEYKILAETVRHELKISGVIDENGVAIPGPVGPASTIPGPKGDSIVGGVGRDGHDAQIVVGDVAVGEKASVSVREENGVHVLDFVLPRAERGEKGDTGAAGRDGADSNVQGPRGEIGPEGIQGIPGVGLSKLDVIALVTDMKRRGSL